MSARTLSILAVLLLLPPLLLLGADTRMPGLLPSSYIPAFHFVVEVFAVVVAALVFATGYHVLDQQRSRVSLLLACTFLAVGLLDLFHIMTYPGIPVLDLAQPHHQTALFWLAARLIAAVGILLYVLLPQLSLNRHTPNRRTLLWTSLGGVSFVAWIGFFLPHWVPDTYNAEQGLTFFKIATEWLIITLHLATLAAIAYFRARLDRKKHTYLACALLILIGSELFFTLYDEMTDSYFVLGHVYKVLAYLLIYRCMFIDSVCEPLLRLDQARQALAVEENRFQQLIDTAPDGVLVIGQRGRILLANQNSHTIFGYAPGTMINMSLSALLMPCDPELDPWGTGTDIPLEPRCLEPQRRVPQGRRADNVLIPLDIRSTRLADESGERLTLFVRDITDRTKQEDALHHQAMHDALTGLPNRTLLHDRLAAMIARSQRDGTFVAVALFDLDQFKLVNDRFGHLIGDELIITTARRLESGIRAADTAARIGGDEFVVLLGGLKAPETAIAALQQIAERLAEPVALSNGQAIPGRASIGISFAPTDSTDGFELLRFADLAMYQAKRQRRGSYSIFSPALDRDLQRDLELVDRLRRAIEKNELVLHFQPQIYTASNRIIGAEALLRWNDPEFGEVSPASFIPLAEKCDLIERIDSLVLEQACAQIFAWHAAGTPLRVAINLSASQFCAGGLEARIADALSKTGAPASLLELEITESAAIENLALAEEQLWRLRALGVKVALDDFGTGHSSLSYLKRLPICKLKIDRLFLASVGHTAADDNLLKAIISLGVNLGKTVIAEGVETQEQLAFIRETGCYAWQGWAAYPSLTAAALTALLESQTASEGIGFCQPEPAEPHQTAPTPFP